MCGRIRDAREGCQCIRPIPTSVRGCALGSLRENVYHVESNDIFEGYFAGLVFLDKNFVDTNGT
jgi:hypothetical protein